MVGELLERRERRPAQALAEVFDGNLHRSEVQVEVIQEVDPGDGLPSHMDQSELDHLFGQEAD